LTERGREAVDEGLRAPQEHVSQEAPTGHADRPGRGEIPICVLY